MNSRLFSTVRAESSSSVRSVSSPAELCKPCEQGVPFHLVIQVQAASGYHAFFWGLFVCLLLKKKKKKNTSYFAVALFPNANRIS